MTNNRDILKLDQVGLDLLFSKARTHNGWLDRPVGDDVLRALYDLVKMGPTSANSGPMRVVFLRTAAARERLRPAIFPGNVEKTMAAPVTAIVAYDLKFYEHLPKLMPHKDMRSMFADNPRLAEATAYRNGCLQGGYFIVAARSLGLDCGPMSGFDSEKVDQEFFSAQSAGRDCFPGGQLKSNFLCNLGYGDHGKLFPRSPRLGFDEACTLL